MSDSNRVDPDQLHRATQRAPLSRQSDDLAAGLQDGFLALGRAVDEAQSDWSESDLVARLQTAAVAAKPAAQPVNWAAIQWLAAGVLAASALIATVRVLSNAPGAAPEIVSAFPLPDQREEVVQNELAQAQPESVPSAGGWDDPLDSELTSAATALEGYAGFGAGVDRSLANFHEQLESLSADLAAGSL